MASKFTWFPTLTKSLEKMPEGPRGKMLWMLVQYGTNGIEPDFGDDWQSEALFTSLRNDIDNSIAARNKNKGGRPRKDAKAETGVSECTETSETGVSVNGNCGFGVSETAETGVSEPENPSLYTNPYQSIPSHAIPVQGSADACAAPEGFEPPTAEEVAAYFGANCLNGDPQAFFDFYASQGWRKSNGMPISDWQPQARQWHRRQRELDAESRSRGKPTASEVEAATFKPTRTPEQTRSELERRWREEHPGIDPAKVKAPRGTTADPVALKAYQDARRLLDARAACERRAS